MKQIDTSLRLLFFCGALFFLSKFAIKQTDTFTLSAISSNWPYAEEFATRELTTSESKQLESALNQTYVYFGCGGQAYALFSGDGNYVIKFFKQRLFRPPYFLNTLPLPGKLNAYRKKRNWKRRDKQNRDFFSYKVAFEELQEETGIIYTHLNKTDHLKKSIEVIDRLGIHHKINLDNFDFVVQKMAVRVYDRINQLMADGKVEEAKSSLGSVFKLISTRAKKGYRDRDPNIRTNCGFIGDKAIKIDVGRFVISEEMKTKEGHNREIERICMPFREWIQEHHPALIESYDKQFQEVLE